jgi:hypothetical protein
MANSSDVFNAAADKLAEQSIAYREAQAKLDTSATRKQYKAAYELWITRAEAEAKKLGITLPKDFAELSRNLAGRANYDKHTSYTDSIFYVASTDASRNFSNSFGPEIVVQNYKKNPKDFFSKVIKQESLDYANAYEDYLRNPNSVDTKGYNTYYTYLYVAKKRLQESLLASTSVGFSQKDFENSYSSGVDIYSKEKEQARKDSQDSGFWGALGTFMDIATPLAFAAMTSGLSLPQSLIVNSMWTLSNGGNAEDVIRSMVGSIAADKITGVLKDLNSTIASAGPDVIKPEVSAALVNAERQAVNALALGQDVGKAALAGAGGGAVASATSLATDSAAIQRAAGEYAQARLAGKTQFEALAISLSSFANQQEKDAAQQKVLDEAAKNPDLAKLEGNQVGALTGDQAGGTTGDPTNSLPPVTVTADQELPVQESVGSYTGTEQSELSLQNKALQTDTKSQPKTSKTNNAILLSLINKPLSRSVPIGSPTQTSSTVGSQALGQALRVGDAGAPVFGGDKDKSKRSGWNTESLRYMGNSGDSNG